MKYGLEGCGRGAHTASGAAEFCIALKIIARVAASHAMNDTNIHYLFYYDSHWTGCEKNL